MFGFFKKRAIRTAAAEKMQLTVLFATALHGLSAEAAFGLRDVVRASKPRDFEYSPPGTFAVYFKGSAEGEQQAEKLAEELRTYAKVNAVPAFGVGVNSGECIAEFDAEDHVTFPPIGDMVVIAGRRAQKEAETNEQE